MESELFGYEKGAFTGANRTGKIGLFDRHGGFNGIDLLNKMWQAPLCEKNTDNTYTYSPYSECGIWGYSKYKSRIDDISYALILKQALFSLDEIVSSLPPAVTNIL